MREYGGAVIPWVAFLRSDLRCQQRVPARSVNHEGCGPMPSPPLRVARFDERCSMLGEFDGRDAAAFDDLNPLGRSVTQQNVIERRTTHLKGIRETLVPSV